MQKKKMLQEFLGHRFLVFALFMLIFSGGLKAAEEEYQKKKISVQIVNETIEQALNKIGNIADIRFFYNHASFDFSKKININITDKDVRRASSRTGRTCYGRAYSRCEGAVRRTGGTGSRCGETDRGYARHGHEEGRQGS